MCHGIGFDVSFFEVLRGIDEGIAAAVQAAGWTYCGGRLDRADYPRKPRGGAFATAGEAETRRFSLCCSVDGCRRRATTPSVRFLGRKMYLAVVVVAASIHAVREAEARAAELRAATGVPARTLRRWVTWWRTVFALGSFYRAARADFAPPVDDADLPGDLLARFALPTLGARMLALLRWLSPVTTASCADGARFARAV
jgi:hypothetical protein